MKTTLLIDGNNIAMRNHFKLPYLKTSGGLHTGAVHGFLSTLLVVNRHVRPDKIIIAWDGGRSRWRTELYPDYKANRVTTPDSRQLFAEQAGILRTLCQHLNVTTLYHPGVEADDLLAGYAMEAQKSEQCVIYSSDQDYLQLCNEHIKVLSPTGDRFISPQAFLGCEGWEHILAKCLAGDSSDNISGLKGIGKKTALDMVRKIGAKSFVDLGTQAAMAHYSNGGKRWAHITPQDITEIVLRNYRMMSFDYAVKMLPKKIKPVVGKLNLVELKYHFNTLEMKRHIENTHEFKNLCVPEADQAF